MVQRWSQLGFLLVVLVRGPAPLQAQIDPETRRLFQVGYTQPLEGRQPISGYGFYYLNEPHFPGTNQTLRLALAPVYLDAELGFSRLLGQGTDLAVGLAGGGFADSYTEFRRGQYLQAESFLGHGAEGSVSIYHCFNPGGRIPLYGIVRGAAHYATYDRDTQTAPDFLLPPDRTDFNLRTGLRWGGQEPLLNPPQGLELSVWHETQFRASSGSYGLGNDRSVEPAVHLFWGRASLTYTLPEVDHRFSLSVTAGAAIHADRFSAFRMGGWLPFSSEFSLNLPGYYYHELSASRFGLINLWYALPLDSSARWNFTVFSGMGWVDYLPGLEQPGHGHAGVGAGLTYQSPSHTWQLILGYAHGIEALRSQGRGANAVGIMCQLDLEARRRAQTEAPVPAVSPHKSRGFDWLFRR